jgi:hypothetical protein
MASHHRHAAVALGLCILAGCASTGPDTRRSTSSGDGSNSDAAWAQLDTNHDGYLSVDELDRQHAVGLLRDMRWADANGDGQVSRAEWNAWWPVMTKTAPSENMAGMVESAGPTNGIRSF